MKNLKNLGTPLSRKELREINGGDPSQCVLDWAACYGDCDSSLPGWAGLVQIAGCTQVCNFERSVCETMEAIQESLQP